MFYAEYPPSGGSGGVTSLNDLTGALTLAEGSGITITDNGTDTITIAVTANTFANVFLSNLQSPTAINQDLLPDAPNTRNIGGSLMEFNTLWAGTIQNGVTAAYIDVANSVLIASDGNESVNWEGRILEDSNFATGLDWQNRTLNGSAGAALFSWASNALTASVPLNMNSHKITNLTTPTVTSDAATKGYVDSAAFANKTLSNLTNPTAVSQSLIPGITNTIDIGDGTHLLHSVFMGASGFGYTVNKNLEQRAQFHSAVTSPSGVTDISGILGFGVSSIGYPILIATGNESTANANATGNLYLETGNKSSGTGNSGSIRLQTGTSAGGTRGTINIIDASLAGASNGYVWTLANQTTGAGSWQASGGGGGGANTALSNLASVSINTALIYGPGVVGSLYTADDAAGSQSLTIKSGDTIGSSTAGDLTLVSGNGDTTTGSGGVSGTITIRSGDAAGVVSAINIIGGACTDSTGGGINISGGNGGGGGGAIAITSGAATVTDVGGANIAILTGGAGGVGSSGSVSINTGTSVDGSSGGLTLLSGNVSGSANSGDLYIASGAPTDGTSGGINIATGTPSGTGATGALTMTTGGSSGAGTGSINIASGDSAASGSGDININSGNAAGSNSGSINLITGSSGADRGIISLSALMLKLPLGSSDPTGVTGCVYYNTGSNTIRWYNGVTWASLL